MPEIPKLNHPWLVAVWPGMGNVAVNAGIYLLSKLGMNELAEYKADQLFDVDHVEVSAGIIQPVRHPRNRFYLWKDPKQGHDLVVFLGEAQPPLGKYNFCGQLLSFARELQVQRIFTFAAMATQMHPSHRCRVFGAATDAPGLEELKRLELETLEDGNIGGLNGVLLGVARENDMHGACLLGEMPHIFAQVPFPKASLAILEVFTTISGIELDFTELAEQAQSVEEQMGAFLERVQEQMEQQQGEESYNVEPPAEESAVARSDRQRIERLFEQAAQDRSKAFELKQTLDRLGLFKEYEDRFLDLFKKPS